MSPIGSIDINLCECRVGTFVNGTDIVTRTCGLCKPGFTICDRTNQPFPLPSREGVYIDPLNGEVAVDCPNAAACPKHTNFEDVMKGECAVGYESFQCARCGKGFYRSNGSCRRCNKNAYVLYVVAGLVLIIVIPVLFKLAQFGAFVVPLLNDASGFVSLCIHKSLN